MINARSLRAVEDAVWRGPFLRPLHGSYCFSGIPPTVRWLLTGKGTCALPADVLGPPGTSYDAVVLFFLDALGWRLFKPFLDDAGRHPFVQRVVASGVVSKLTTQFPSTTAAHVTTIHSGLPPGQSGVYEWNQYEPSVGRIITPLRFCYHGDPVRNTLTGKVAPEEVFPKTTLYQALAGEGVASFVYSDAAYAHSPFSRVVCNGATICPFRTLAHGLVELREQMTRQEGRAYYVLYFDRIDSLAHEYGPDSPLVAGEIEATLLVLHRLFNENVLDRLTGRRVLVLVTADHGHVPVYAERTVYLNRELPWLPGWLEAGRDGLPLAPAGSSRDLFLHVRPEHLDETAGRLARYLDGKAVVVRTDELVDGGFFGPGEPSPAFRQRVGNLVILPYEGETVWWALDGETDRHHRGHHGGLTRGEMETILLSYGN